MLLFDIETIYGVQLGIEFADKEVKEHYPGMEWGLTIDLFLFRLVFTKFKIEG